MSKLNTGDLYISIYSGLMFKIKGFGSYDHNNWVYYNIEPDREPYGTYRSTLEEFSKEFRPLTETEKVLYG